MGRSTEVVSNLTTATNAVQGGILLQASAPLSSPNYSPRLWPSIKCREHPKIKTHDCNFLVCLLLTPTSCVLDSCDPLNHKSNYVVRSRKSDLCSTCTVVESTLPGCSFFAASGCGYVLWC